MIRLQGACSFALALLQAPVFAQVIEFESNGQKYQTLTKSGVTIIFTHLPNHLHEYAVIHVAISNGSQSPYVVRPEDFNYIRSQGAAIRAATAQMVVNMLMQKGNANDPAEILSKLIAGTDLVSANATGERLSKLELIHNCIFLLNAGHETTTNLIGNGVDLLIRHPAVISDLRRHPQTIETAVEEFLRMESSNQLGNRRAVKNTVLGGVAIAAGTYVHIGIGAANRDPAQFTEPDRLDIRRAPNRHLAFGTGIHACAGMSLARMEAQVAIGRLLQRFTRIEPAGAFARSGRARFRGFKSYPVRLAM